MKILNVMLGKQKGGLENVFSAYTRLFREIGYESVALCHKKSPYKNDLEKLGIPVYTMTALKINPFTWFRLIWVIKQVQPDVLCLHGNRAVYFATSWILKLFIRPFPKTIATAHNNRNKIFHRLDGVFAISNILKDNLINHFYIPENKVFLCPNAVSLPQSVPPLKYEPHNPIQIGFFGRLHPVKGLDVLLDACQKLKENKVDFKLLVAGDGALLSELQEQVQNLLLKDNVDFLGWIDDKKSFFDKIDILCIPSRSEGQPLTLLEGLSYAKPLIVSSCPGMLEVVNQTKCALSFPIEDSNRLFECLLELIQNPQKCDEFSQNAYQLFLKKYTEEAQKKNLVYGIEKICQN